MSGLYSSIVKTSLHVEKLPGSTLLLWR